MGEETEQEKVKEETQPEEMKEEKTEEKTDEKPEEKPSPVIVLVDLHCVGCAKKIERSIMKFRGVEEVVIDMTQNQVTIKGIIEPQALCKRIQKETKRRAKILSPLPTAEGDPIPKVVTSQVNEPTTVELNVNMHCEACAQQLKSKILKMRGVQTAETELSTGKVTVTGTMDANRLVDYVYRRTKKQARIVPLPEPVNEKQEEKEEVNEKPAEEAAKPEEKKEENEEKKEEEEKKDGNNSENNSKEEKGDESKEEAKKEGEENNINEETMRKTMMMMMYNYPPHYVIEQIPPPQLFSDENPNACCIT